MGIMKNLDKVHVAVVIDTFNGGNLGQQLSAAAMSAIMKGLGSPEWKKYMSLFADNAEQLTRLTVEDEDEPVEYRWARAYIVSNAVCGAGTTGQTKQNVPTIFDDNLTEAADGTVQKPFPIPEV